MFALKLLCIFICVFYSNCVLLTSPSSAGSYVEQLIHNYFREEEKLWTSLENRADNLLPQIYRMHEEFLNDVISNTESGVFNKYLVPGHYKLVLIGLNLNGTTKLGYSNLRDKEFDREFITDYANSALKILKDASEMFDFTNNASFWEGIISVSDFSKIHIFIRFSTEIFLKNCSILKFVTKVPRLWNRRIK